MVECRQTIRGMSLADYGFIAGCTGSIIGAVGSDSAVIRLLLTVTWLLVAVACVVAHVQLTRR